MNLLMIYQLLNSHLALFTVRQWHLGERTAAPGGANSTVGWPSKASNLETPVSTGEKSADLEIAGENPLVHGKNPWENDGKLGYDRKN